MLTGLLGCAAKIIDKLLSGVRPVLCERNHAQVKGQQCERHQRSGCKRAKERHGADTTINRSIRSWISAKCVSSAMGSPYSMVD